MNLTHFVVRQVQPFQADQTCEHFCAKPLKTVMPQIETVEGVKAGECALSDL